MSDHRYVGNTTYRGTTTVGLVCQGGVVLATDTRVTSGYLFIAHKKGKKIYQIDDRLAMTIAGAVADAQNVIDMLKYNVNLYKLEKMVSMPVRAAARLISNVFFFSRLFPYITDVLVAGLDSQGPNVYNVDLFGSLNEGNYMSTGSGSPVAYGILESEYREGLSIQAGIALATKAVTAAMKRNAGTGDSFDVAVIDTDGYRELMEEEKNVALDQIIRRG